MNFLNRRTIRKYTDEVIEDKILNEIIGTALVSPSGKNLKPYEFLIVNDKEKLLKFSQMKALGTFSIPGANHAIIVLGNPEISDTWVEDCSIASTIIMLKSWDLGIGSCWVQMHNRKDAEGRSSEELIKEYLNIPAHLRVLNIISLGYPAEERGAYTQDNMDFSKVHREKY